MDGFHFKKDSPESWNRSRYPGFVALRKRLRKWQQVRTWARLIREAESLWRVDVRELRRIGAIELSQLLEEVPPAHRRRVNRWLIKYSASTRFNNHSETVLFDNSNRSGGI